MSASRRPPPLVTRDFRVDPDFKSDPLYRWFLERFFSRPRADVSPPSPTVDPREALQPADD